ncbi:MAG: Cys-tRNA(Pro) deacylase [Clostridia bacterium]|nr:Cys-tRNA(Pro) deacylase [Clostridia bacterium]
MEKTNVMRVLDQKKITYKGYEFPLAEAVNGVEIASLLNQDPKRVFKTLVTVGKSKKYYVFMIPVEQELDLKKGAKAVGEKAIEMVKSKELLPLTGYVHGGCSPIGMKKFFTTTVHITAKDFDTIFFSAGKIGYQVEVAPSDLEKVIRLSYYEVV